MWALLAALFALCIKEKVYMRVWYVCVLLFGSVLILGDITYSPIDEASHLDYIQYIIENKQLPTMWQTVDGEFLSAVNETEDIIPVRRYEAVHMPLYYCLMAVLAAPVPNLLARFLVIRFFGLACLAGVAVITQHTLHFLGKQELIACSEKDGNLFVALLAVNPGILVRFVRVSNEPLAVLLAAGIFYCAVRLLTDGYHAGIFRLGAFMSVLLYYTKSTGAFFVGALLLVLLYYKKWMHFAGLIIFYIFCAVPWFIHCYRLYGSLTGMNEHVNIVLPIVNPNHEPINLITGIYRLFAMGFFQANEVVQGSVFYSGITEAVNILLLALCMAAAVWSAANLYQFVLVQHLQFTYSLQEKGQALMMLSAGMVFCNIASLALATATNHIGALNGRYLYFSILPLAVFLLKLTDKVNIKRAMQMFFCIFYSLLFLHTICHYTNTIGRQHGWWGEQYEQAVIRSCIKNEADLAAGVKLNQYVANAKQLEGKVLVADNGQNAVIEHAVRENGEDAYMFGYPVPELAQKSAVHLYDAATAFRYEYYVEGMRLVELGGICALEQSFAWQGGSIDSISLMTANYQAVQHGSLHVSLLDADGKTLQEAFADMQYCVDNGWTDVWFYQAAKLEPGTYKIRIEPAIDEGSALCIYAGDTDGYSDGALFIEDAETGTDMNFQINSLDESGGK